LFNVRIKIHTISVKFGEFFKPKSWNIKYRAVNHDGSFIRPLKERINIKYHDVKSGQPFRQTVKKKKEEDKISGRKIIAAASPGR